MSKILRKNWRISLVIVLAVVFAILLIIPAESEAWLILAGTKMQGPGGGTMCACEVAPYNCACVFWE